MRVRRDPRRWSFRAALILWLGPAIVAGLADPAHLDSLLASLKRIDSVYDAYRVLPGKGS